MVLGLKADLGVAIEVAQTLAAHFTNRIKNIESDILNTQRQLQGAEVCPKTACGQGLAAVVVLTHFFITRWQFVDAQGPGCIVPSTFIICAAQP